MRVTREYYDEVVMKVKVYVAPCIKCDGQNIHLSDDNESSFNKGGGTCLNPQCKFEAWGDVGWNPKKSRLAEIWNEQNDPDKLIAEIDAKISGLEVKRDEISAIIVRRKNKPK